MRVLSNTALLAMVTLLWSCSTPVPKKSPLPQHKDVVEIDHSYFRIGYDPELRLAQYVVYELTADKLRSRTAKRRDNFRVDPVLIEKKHPYVRPVEYKKSGYDQGHLAPSADFLWSQSAQDLTFVMSNMAPQKPRLNRDAWRRLEEKVRRWACGEQRVTVITGPIINRTDQKLASGLVIPSHFYKIIVDETPPRKVLSFVYHQDDAGDIHQERQVGLTEIVAMMPIKVDGLISEYSTLSRSPASLNSWKEADCTKGQRSDF